MVLEKKIFKVFPFYNYKTINTLDPQGLASLDPRGMVGRIYVNVGDHLTLLHAKYIGPCGFRENSLSFSHNKSINILDARAWPV